MKLNTLQKIQLLILNLLLSYNCYSQETFIIPKNKIGVTMRAEFVKDDFVDNLYIPHDPMPGLGMELGVYYEKRLAKRFVLSTELNFRYREFTKAYSVYIQTPSANYDDPYSVFEVDWKLLTITPSVGLRMYFFKKPKIYAEIGGGIDYRLSTAPSQEYKTTAFYDGRDLVSTEYRPADRVREKDFIFFYTRVYTRFEMGLGIEINKIDMGLFYRREISESIGIRVRYSLLER